LIEEAMQINSQPDLSIVMIAMNEERTIGETLTAIKSIAREIIVVDSGSTDNTKEVAAECGARVLHRDWKGYADQKNFALDQAACSWVLSIDADEILSPELVTEIRNMLGSNVSDRTVLSGSARIKHVGFKLPRVLYIGDTPIWHGGFYPDAQLRLIRKGAGHFNNRLVHESISVDGPVMTFKHHMLHKAYANIEEFENALDKYARLSAEEFSGGQVSWWDTSLLNQSLHPIWTFFYRYVLRAGFLDGTLGFRLADIYSSYVAKKILYLHCTSQ
jgi:glycosyltransferase involved in cell wall biosynthesis